jgi:hypothetical protein
MGEGDQIREDQAGVRRATASDACLCMEAAAPRFGIQPLSMEIDDEASVEADYPVWDASRTAA